MYCNIVYPVVALSYIRVRNCVLIFKEQGFIWAPDSDKAQNLFPQKGSFLGRENADLCKKRLYFMYPIKMGSSSKIVSIISHEKGQLFEKEKKILLCLKERSKFIEIDWEGVYFQLVEHRPVCPLFCWTAITGYML